MADLITILNPGWPVRHAGRTYWLCPFGPYAWARLNQWLRERYVAEADDKDAAIAAVHRGGADHGSEWARRYERTEAGTVLTIAAMLSTRQPDITPEDVVSMLADETTAAALTRAITMAVPPAAPVTATTEADSDPTNWENVIGTLMKLHPAWTPADIARLSDMQIKTLFDAAAFENGSGPKGEWTLDDIEPAPQPQ